MFTEQFKKEQAAPHEPANRKSLEIKGAISRFMRSEDGPMAAHGDHEPGWFICRPSTINPSTINRFMKSAAGLVDAE